jgi:hypothetical protein
MSWFSSDDKKKIEVNALLRELEEKVITPKYWEKLKPLSQESDEPETYDNFLKRVGEPVLKPDATLIAREMAYRPIAETWAERERQKAVLRKARLIREKEEARIMEREEREARQRAERDQRDAQRKLEREQREAQHKLERELEKERQNPTPQVQPPDSPDDIPYNIRDQHIFIPGRTRHGKTSQLINLIKRDIDNGHGVGVLDPKGDLIRRLCAILPENRLDDCIYLDLETPIPLDIMRRTTDPEALVGDIKALVLKGDTTLKRAEPILTRMVYTLLEVPGTRFTDIEDIFTVPKRKKAILDALEKINPERHDYWRNNWPSPDRWEPLVNRMTDFTQNKSLKAILGEPAPELDLRKAMDERKIILVNLGGTGEAREIYGALLVSRFQQAAFSRTDIHESKRVPFFLFVDEFENFQTSSFAKIFSVAGGLGLRIAVGNQYIDQLNDDIRHAVIGNAGTFIIFQIREMLSLFRNVVHPYDFEHIGRLPKHQAIYKIGDQPPIFKWTKAPPKFEADEERIADQIALKLKAKTLAKYGPSDKRNTSAQNGSKRPVHNDPSDTTKNMPKLEEDDEDIKPGA